jgi:hypothetical protein
MKVLVLRKFAWLRRVLIVLSVGILVQPLFAHTYDVMDADVPFKFKVGERTFRPGHYQLIMVGNGLVAVRDSHAHVVATITTRPSEMGAAAPTTKLVFQNEKKIKRLNEIWLANRREVLQVMGEELAFRQPTPAEASSAIPFDAYSLFGGWGPPGMKH